MKDQLLCGAAKVKITPPEEYLYDLRGLMDSGFGGVTDDLFVRAISLSNDEGEILLLSFDLDKVPCPQECLDLLEKTTGIAEENILLAAIHTHSAPVAGDRTFEGPNNIAGKPEAVRRATGKYEVFLMEQMLLAVRKAREKREPSVMSYGYGESFVNVTRIAFYETEDASGFRKTILGTGTNFKEPADHTLFVMQFASMKGDPIAFWINYPVHNTVMILNGCGKDGKVGISADLGGNVSKLMEKKYQGAVAAWTSGAAGDLNPIMSNQVYREDPVTGVPMEVYEKDGEIALSMLKTLSAHHLADIRRVLPNMKRVEERIDLSGKVRWAETPGKDEAGTEIPYRVRVHRMTVGPITLFGFGGELYSGLGKRLIERNGGENTILVNHDASLLYNTGYIYGDEIFELSRKYPGEIVGLNHTWLQPGMIEGALGECMEALGEKDKEKNHELSAKE